MRNYQHLIAYNFFFRKTTELILRSPPTLISLAGGMPNTSLFPFQSFEIKATNNIDIILSGKELSNALQYCSSSGYKLFSYAT